jgi:hypothetical protein
MRLISAMLSFTLLILTPSFGQEANNFTAFVKPSGSVPPIPELYRCVSALNGKPYDASASTACLQSILSSGYFLTGRVDVASGSSNTIAHFVLDAPRLIIGNIDFNVQDSIREPMVRWIQKTGQSMAAGDVYEPKRDDRTIQLVQMYFWNIGKRVGVSRNVSLDYRSGTAGVSYQIAIGPDMVPMRALPPFNPECPVSIGAFNLSDIDDYASVTLVEKMTKTHAFGCFDPHTMSNDARILEHSNLFQEVRYDVQGDGPSRDVSLHIRGKHLEISQVEVVGYGILSTKLFEHESLPDLKAGDIYRRSAAEASVEYLKNKYARPNEVVEVFEDDRLASDDRILVTFQILAYDEDKVILNGKEFRVAPVVSSGTSEAR